MHNCDLVNLEDMLQNGTVISGTYIDTPIDVTFHRNGEVEVKVDISVEKNANPTKVSVAIQQEISNALQEYTESVPFAITINITSII